MIGAHNLFFNSFRMQRRLKDALTMYMISYFFIEYTYPLVFWFLFQKQEASAKLAFSSVTISPFLNATLKNKGKFFTDIFPQKKTCEQVFSFD